MYNNIRNSSVIPIGYFTNNLNYNIDSTYNIIFPINVYFYEKSIEFI